MSENPNKLWEILSFFIMLFGILGGIIAFALNGAWVAAAHLNGGPLPPWWMWVIAAGILLAGLLVATREAIYNRRHPVPDNE